MANNNLKNPIKATPAEMRAKMQKLKVVYDWPKINLDDDIEVQDRVQLYFDYSLEAGLRPNVEGLALAIGVNRRTLWDWENGNSRSQLGSSRSDIIKKAKDYISFLMSDAAMNGDVNPITWIFYAKNYFGMKDVQEVTFSGNNPLGDQMSAEEIMKQLPADIPVDVEYKEV